MTFILSTCEDYLECQSTVLCLANFYVNELSFSFWFCVYVYSTRLRMYIHCTLSDRTMYVCMYVCDCV